MRAKDIAVATALAWVALVVHLYVDSAGHRSFACFVAALILTVAFWAKFAWEDYNR